MNGRPCAWRGQPRLDHWNRPGPKKGAGATIRTRFASALYIAALGTRGPVRVDCRRFSGCLGVPAETLRKATMALRERAWSFQTKHIVLYLTPSRTGVPGKGKGKPQLWAILRHRLNRLHWNARWHWRHGSVQEWGRYFRWIEKLAFAMTYRGKKTCDGKLKGFSTATSRSSATSALDPPASKAAWRRYGRIAGKINRHFESFAAAPSANIKSWAVNRLREQHRYSDILLNLDHAIALYVKFNRSSTDKPVAWILAVAKRRLNNDGMVPTQRRRLPWRPTDKAGAYAPAFKEKISEPAAAPREHVDDEGRIWVHSGGTYWKIK